MSLRISSKSLDGVRSFVERIPSAVEHVGAPIANTLEQQIVGRIATEKSSPEGRTWPGWSRDYARSGRGRDLLERSGRLLSSIHSNRAGDSIEVGSDLDYALAQNVRRPFLGIGADDERELQTMLEAELSRRLAAA